jgi:hypothetical protein
MITYNEIVHISKSEGKKFSFLCTLHIFTFLGMAFRRMLFSPDTVLFVLCFGGFLYSLYYCVQKFLQDHSVTNTG